jgi:4-hydroxybenzoate polyprenyltransferase
VLGIIALALLSPLNRPTQILAVIGGVLAVTYPFLKRFFALPQAYLGLAFSWSVPMAFTAQTGELPLIAWVLFVAGVLWTTAYDTIYAMVDREDDLVIGIRSSAILFGKADRGIIALLQTGAVAGLALVGHLTGMGRWYWAGLAVAAALSMYQQYLIRHRNPGDCFRAFLNNNLFGLAIFGGILLDYLFSRA